MLAFGPQRDNSSQQHTPAAPKCRRTTSCALQNSVLVIRVTTSCTSPRARAGEICCCARSCAEQRLRRALLRRRIAMAWDERAACRRPHSYRRPQKALRLQREFRSAPRDAQTADSSFGNAWKGRGTRAANATGSDLSAVGIPLRSKEPRKLRPAAEPNCASRTFREQRFIYIVTIL